MPEPRKAAEAKRMAHSALRQRIMNGTWRADAYQRMIETVGLDRTRAWGSENICDIGTPLLRQAAVRNATLYLRPPYFEHPADTADGGPGMVMNALLLQARWGSLMTGVLQAAIALNDAAVRYEVTLTEDGTPMLRLYTRSVADLMARGRRENPSQPRKVYETVDYRGQSVWRVWDDDERWLEDADGVELAGTRAPHGQGQCPWVLWHTTPNEQPFSPYVNSELVDLTLGLSVAESFRSHALFEAAWPQRYCVNVQPAGVGVESLSGEPRQSVTADPATVLLLEQTGDTGQPMVGQWQAGADPRIMAEAVERQQRRSALAIGASGSDVFRASGETRSAYSLEITRQNQRTQQTNLAPLCEPSDTYLARGIAMAVDTRLGSEVLPLDGYRIRYRILSPSAEEVDLATKMMDANLISMDQARLMLDPFSQPPLPGAGTEAAPATAGPSDDIDSKEVSELALDGGQISSAQAIVESTVAGRLPRASALEMLSAFFAMPRDVADAILGPVGQGFTPAQENET